MTTYTDKVLKHNWPNITLVHKDTQKWTLIDIAVPVDQNITRTQEEKVEKYQELTFEIRRIHGASKVTIIPIVTGALESISKGAKTWFGKLVWFGHSWNCSPVAESVESLSYGELLRTNQLYQEPITLSVRLNYTCATAFSQVRLFFWSPMTNYKKLS